MTKYQEIAHLLRHRLERGEYPSGKLPPLRKLAADMGVSYLTARQAVKTFQDAGWHEIRAARPLVAMVAPLWNFNEWHRAIRDESRELGGQVRVIAYGSETDPVISETIAQEDYDLIFLFPPNREDSRLLELIEKSKDRVVVMFRDLSERGIRCLDGADPHTVERFLEILRGRGVRRIDALGHDFDLKRGALDRYRTWRDWIDRNGMTGNFHGMPYHAFEPDDVRTAEFCRKKLDAGELGEAVFCFTPTMAMGLYRACYERGIVPGRDISVFSFGDQLKATVMTPALATVLNVDIPGTIRKVIREYCPGAIRSKQLFFRLEKNDIFMGESLIPQKEESK